jgi:hypothetical protein
MVVPMELEMAYSVVDLMVLEMVVSMVISMVGNLAVLMDTRLAAEKVLLSANASVASLVDQMATKLVEQMVEE